MSGRIRSRFPDTPGSNHAFMSSCFEGHTCARPEQVLSSSLKRKKKRKRKKKDNELTPEGAVISASLPRINSADMTSNWIAPYCKFHPKLGTDLRFARALQFCPVLNIFFLLPFFFIFYSLLYRSTRSVHRDHLGCRSSFVWLPRPTLVSLPHRSTFIFPSVFPNLLTSSPGADLLPRSLLPTHLSLGSVSDIVYKITSNTRHNNSSYTNIMLRR